MDYVDGDHSSSDTPDEARSTLRRLRACDAASPNVVFGFDIPHGTFVADIPAHVFGLLAISGPMRLAAYNELKRRQYIHEDDGQRRSAYRWFTLTDPGRRRADGRST